MNNYAELLNELKKLTKRDRIHLLREKKIEDENLLDKLLKESAKDEQEYISSVKLILRKPIKSFDVEKFFDNDLDRMKVYISMLFESKYFSEFYDMEQIKNIVHNNIKTYLIMDPLLIDEVDDDIYEMIQKDNEFLLKYFPVAIMNKKFNDFEIFNKKIPDNLWIDLFNNHKSNIAEMTMIVDRYRDVNSANSDISIFTNNMNADEIFRFINSSKYYTKNIKLFISRIGEIQDTELFNETVFKMIKDGREEAKKMFLDVMDENLIQRFVDFNDDVLDVLGFYELVMKNSNEEIGKFIISKEDDYYIKKMKESIKNNDIRIAFNYFREISDKDKCKSEYEFFMMQQNISFSFYKWDEFYIKDAKLLELYINRCDDRYRLSKKFLEQLAKDGRSDLAIKAAGFDKKISFEDAKKARIHNLLYLKELGITNDYIEELYGNYEMLKKYNSGINPENPDFSLAILDSNILKDFSPKFITDVIEYHGGMYNFLNNKESLKGLEEFLNKNNLYSKSNIHCILYNFDKLKPLIITLINENSALTEEEIDNFERYIKHYSGDIRINNLSDLRDFKSKIVEQNNKAFEQCDGRNKLKTILYKSLFDYEIGYLTELAKNPYLIDRMMKAGLLDDYDLGLLEVIKDIENSKGSLEEIKDKYKNIVSKNISLNKLYHDLMNKYKNYFESKIANKEENIKIIEGSKREIKQYQGQNIEVVELESDNFQFLVHGIGDGNDIQTKVDTQNLKSTPSMWNGEDNNAGLSCSLIGDNHLVYVDGGTTLGFYNLPSDALIGMLNNDAMLTHGYNVYKPGMAHGSTFESPRKLLKRSTQGYNEIGLYRKNSNLKEHNGKIQPDFILSKSKEPTSNELAYAAYFGIPIIKLDKEKYEQRRKENIEKYKSGNLDKFTIKDVKNILCYQEFTEQESMNLIMQYISKLNLPEDIYNEFINQVKEELIDFYITEPEKINAAINMLNANRKVFSQEEEETYGYK